MLFPHPDERAVRARPAPTSPAPASPSPTRPSPGRPSPGRPAAAALRAGAAALLLAMAAGCAALPRSGPLATDIEQAADPAAVSGLVVPLSADVALRTRRPEARSFPAAFLSAEPVDPERLGVGDVLDVLVWEASETGLLDTGGGAVLSGVRVETGGRIYVPFAGYVAAAGTTPAQLRDRIGEALAPFMLDPQVDVRLALAGSRRVMVHGAVARPGPYTLERGATRLLSTIAGAGGSALPPGQVEVALRRGATTGAATLEALYLDPALDLALRPDDQIIVTPIRERIVVLGAASAQGEIGFPSRPFTLLQAIGAARGLSDFDADPTGVFVFRYEARSLADALLAGPPLPELPLGDRRPVVYRLDMTRQGALFAADAFHMQDGDAIFVTNAPLTELRKILQLFTAVTQPIIVTNTLSAQ